MEELDTIEGVVREVVELSNGKLRISLRKKMTADETTAVNARSGNGGAALPGMGGNAGDVIPGDEIYKFRIPAASLVTPLMPGDQVTIRVYRGVAP